MAGCYEDLVYITVICLSSGDQRCHQVVLADVLEHFDTIDVQDLTLLSNSCAFGPVTGLSRASPSLTTIAHSHLTLKLQEKDATQLLVPFESVRPGTEIFFHSVGCSRPHRFDKDVRCLRLL